LLVKDLESCLPKLGGRARIERLEYIIQCAKREEFHDFYASEDSDRDVKGVFEPCLMLKQVDHPSTDEIAKFAREGKYDA